MIVDRAAVLRFRLRATHLDRRLEPGALAAAARSGLQDSSPRSGLLSLHARVRDVAPDAWEHPSLAQVFGPRGAVYVVPRADVAVFTLGLLPRDQGRRREIEADAERICARLAAGDGLPNTRRVRWAGATGRLLPRWDARTSAITPAPPPDADVEQCRQELARRFLHAAGPATSAQLQWFADGSRLDAEATLMAIRDELVPVDVAAGRRWLLASDEQHLAEAGPVAGVRLLPPDDPFLSRADKELLLPDRERRAEVWPKAPPPGALLVDGDIAGTWRRQGPRISVRSWVASPPRRAVEREAAAMPFAGGAQVRWA